MITLTKKIWTPEKSKLKFVIVTTTYSNSVNDFRAGLALKTVEAAKKEGYEIVVVDGSPDEKFKDALTLAGAHVFMEKTKGMGTSRRQSIKTGFDIGGDVVAWIEPEKYPVIPLLLPLFKMIQTESAQIIIPKRKSLEGYPPYQMMSENRLNQELGLITNNKDLDLCFGPRIFNKAGGEYFLNYKGERGDNWESIFIPILRALRDGVKITSEVINYVHPPEQTAVEIDSLEMNRKRDFQREVLVNAMGEEANILNTP